MKIYKQKKKFVELIRQIVNLGILTEYEMTEICAICIKAVARQINNLEVRND